MADRPIIMSAPMVQSMLAGRKTQARRIIKLPTKAGSGLPIYEHPQMGGWAPTTSGGGGCFTIGRDGQRVPAPERVAIWHQTCGNCLEIRYQPGDRLWVRESWAAWMHAPAISVETMAGQLSRSEIAYKATDDGWDDLIADRNALRELASKTEDGRIGNWVVRSPIHMPRWASRLTLNVTEVRVQRLQDISEDDAAAEGVDAIEVGAKAFERSARFEFAALWQSIHGDDTWAANPWVCAISFDCVARNIDASGEPDDANLHDDALREAQRDAAVVAGSDPAVAHHG